jgi:CheY-like chemotaxis protein
MDLDPVELAFRRLVAQGVVNVLIVDDEEPVARSLGRLLVGCNVVIALNGREALALVLSGGQTFHLILCDLVMPEVDGSVFFNAIQVAAPQLADRVIFMSGGAITPSTQTFLEQVRERCLQKPFTRAELFRLVTTRVVAPP